MTLAIVTSADELPDAEKAAAANADYFPPPVSAGGWRKLDSTDDMRPIARMDSATLDSLREWLLTGEVGATPLRGKRV